MSCEKLEKFTKENPEYSGVDYPEPCRTCKDLYNCYGEPGTDADFDRYAVQVQNGEGYYDNSGNYVSYHIDDDDYWEQKEREREEFRSFDD